MLSSRSLLVVMVTWVFWVVFGSRVVLIVTVVPVKLIYLKNIGYFADWLI